MAHARAAPGTGSASSEQTDARELALSTVLQNLLLRDWVELTEAQHDLIRYNFTLDDQYTKGYIVTANDTSYYWFPHRAELGEWPAHHLVTKVFCTRLATLFPNKQVADTASYCFLIADLDSTAEHSATTW